MAFTLAATSRRSCTLFAGLAFLSSFLPAGASAAGDGAGGPLARASSTSSSWSFEGGPFSITGSSIATVGDLDGDGASDFAIGAPDYDDPTDGLAAIGAVYIVRGALDGLPGAPSQTLLGSPAAGFGASVAAAGDVNGDGYGDLIVGAPSSNFDGKVSVYLGSPSGLQTPAAWSFTYLDAGLVGARLGASVGTAGDVDADGYDDVVVGAPDSGDFRGAAFLFRGNPVTALSATPDWSVAGGTGWRLGSSVSTAGDVDADGYSDVIVGVPHYSGSTPQGVAQYGGCFYYRGGWPGGPQGLPGLTPYTTSRIAVEQFGASFGASVALAGDVNGDGFGDVVVGAPTYDAFGLTDIGRASTHLGGPSGLQETPFWYEYGLAQSTRFGAVVACAGDVDGDGLADVAAGAPDYTGDQSLEGYAVIAQGGRAGMLIRWYVEGNLASGRFGSSLATAGDVDGDGFSDLLVGSPTATITLASQGRVQLFRGRADAPASSAAWTRSGAQFASFFGWVVDRAGDVNGDGYDDVLVGAPNYTSAQANDGAVTVYFGARSGPGTVGGPNQPITWSVHGEASSQSFGASTACAGDVNGDGYDDIIVGAHAAFGVGRVYVWHGGPLGPSLGAADWSADGPHADARFGWSVSGAGDVNGDGYADVVIGAPGVTTNYSGEGQTYVYHGSAQGLQSTPAWFLRGNQEGAGLGNSVSAAGDVNRDGYADVVVGMQLWDRPAGILSIADAGRAFVIHGSPNGLPQNAVNTILQGSGNDLYGSAVGAAGDVDGDGFSDIIVAATGVDPNDTGVVHVYRGSPNGIQTTLHWSFSTGQAFCGFGVNVGTAGDVNRDGLSDVVVSANFYDSSSRIDNGSAWCFAGPLTGTNASVPLWQAAGASSYENFGQSVAGIGDVNGDGFPDLATGATGYSGAYGSEGQVKIFYGNVGAIAPSSDDGVSRKVRQLRTSTLTAIALDGRTEGSPQFSIALDGPSAAGRTRVRLEFETDALGIALDGGAISSTPAVDSQPAGTNTWPVLSVHGLNAEPGTPTIWRARVRADSPFFPTSPWFAMAGNGVGESDLRAGTSVTAVDGPSPQRGAIVIEAAPNPFNPRTSIAFVLDRRSEVEAVVFDARGRAVRTLVDEVLESGRQTFVWDGSDDEGGAVASGNYFVRVSTPDRSGTHKLALVR